MSELASSAPRSVPDRLPAGPGPGPRAGGAARRGISHRSLVLATLLLAGLLAASPVAGAFASSGNGLLGPDRLPVAWIGTPFATGRPETAVLVATSSKGEPVALGQGVAIATGTDGEACRVLTVAGAIGRSHQVAALFGDGVRRRARRVVAWEPAPGLAVLEFPGCAATVELPAEGTAADELIGRLGVVSAPLESLPASLRPATLVPGPGSRGTPAGRDATARIRVEPSPFALVLPGAPVFDEEDRLVGLLGRPGKEEGTFEFVPLPPRGTLLEDRGRKRSFISLTRLQTRFHPVRGKLDHFNLGMGRYWLGHYAAALREFNALVQADEAGPLCLLALADTALGLGWNRPGASELAIATYERVMSRLPANAVVTARAGTARLVDSDTRGAEPLLRRALEALPDDPWILTNLGACLLAEGRAEEASELLVRAARLLPDQPTPLLDLALARYLRGVFDEALETIDRALELDEDDPEILAAKGMILIQLERWHEAREILEKARKKDPGSFLVLLNLGIAQVLCGDAEKGRETLTLATLWSLGDPWTPRLRLVLQLLWKGETVRAIRLLHRLTRPGDLDVDTWRALAEAAEIVKRWPQAASAWRKVVQGRPDDMKAKAHLGVALLFSKRHDEAADVLAECVERAPDSPRLLGYLALARIGQGRDDDARELVERLERLDPALAGQVRAAWEKKREASGEDDARSSK